MTKKKSALKKILLLSVILIGVTLILNPLYFYSDGGGAAQMTYEVDTIDNESVAEAATLTSEQVMNCPNHRECIFEEEVLEEESVEYEGRVDRGPMYPVVQFGDTVYEPQQEIDGNATTYALTEISYSDAIENMAVPADERSTGVQEAVETGSVTVYDEEIAEFEDGTVIEDDGEYYYSTGYSYQEGHWTGGMGLGVARALLTVAGTAILVYSGMKISEGEAS